MKLFRFGPAGAELPGVQLPDGRRIDVSSFHSDYNENFFRSGGLERLRSWIMIHEDDCPEVPEDVRLGPCIARPSKMICIGLNYADHATESGADLPKEPILFFKSTSSICGPNDDLILPPGSEKTDWEVELAVVIRKRCSHVEKADAMEFVAGYCLHNDYSERAYQLERGGQWVKGKSYDRFAPLGPYLVTPDAIDDPHKLHLWLDVNGERMQDSNTSNFVFDIPTIISYISDFMTLLPGDVISTGTPAGVGLGLKPERYLRGGDVVESGIEGLGEGKQLVQAV